MRRWWWLWWYHLIIIENVSDQSVCVCVCVCILYRRYLYILFRSGNLLFLKFLCLSHLLFSNNSGSGLFRCDCLDGFEGTNCELAQVSTTSSPTSSPPTTDEPSSGAATPLHVARMVLGSWHIFALAIPSAIFCYYWVVSEGIRSRVLEDGK